MHAKPGKVAVLLLAAALPIAIFWGCASFKSARSGRVKLFSVASDFAPFYYYGPKQASGPDKALPKDTLMTLIRPSLGFCKVKLTTGEEGFIRSDDIHVASSDLIAETNAPLPSTSGLRMRADSPDLRRTSPVSPPEFEPSPIPLPPDLRD